MTIYRYGLMAWFWRVLIAGALLGGTAVVVPGAERGEPVLLLMGLILLAPAVFFGLVVAVHVVNLDDQYIRVSTLLFWHRHVSRSALGAPRIHRTYEGRSGPMHAPRAWIPVRGQLPIYLDLQGDITDRRAFGAIFRV